MVPVGGASNVDDAQAGPRYPPSSSRGTVFSETGNYEVIGDDLSGKLSHTHTHICKIYVNCGRGCIGSHGDWRTKYISEQHNEHFYEAQAPIPHHKQ